MAVEAMKKHAYDYIQKPFENEQLKLTVKKALENYRLVKENKLLTEALSDRYRYGNIIGKSKPVLKVFDLIDKVSNQRHPCLLPDLPGLARNWWPRPSTTRAQGRTGRLFLSIAVR